MRYRFKHLICPLCALAAVLLILLAFGFWNTQNTAQRLRILADATTLPAVFFLAFSAFSYIGRSGIFDIFGYGFCRLSSLLIPRMPREHETYLDYKERVALAQDGSHAQAFYTGLFLLILSAIFIFFYYKAI